ncbi:MAG TPA: hypothetical protein VD997_18020 [Phycisphaerales bacterium]|nr:hypothetical protein [Phycisphaerales bacterium]
MTAHAAIALVIICSCVLGACEKRVVRYNPFLGGLPNAESGTPVVRGDMNYQDPTAIPEDKLVVEDPVTKKKTLTTRSGRHLMVHIYNALKDNDKKTFVDQILASETKAECAARGVDPGETFDELVRRRDDVLALFNAMPNAELTPGAISRKLGPKTQRVEVQGLGAKDLTWTGFDMVMEKGNWKLRWFYGPDE